MLTNPAYEQLLQCLIDAGVQPKHFNQIAERVILQIIRERVDPYLVIPVIEHGIKMEKLNLQANTILGNKVECYIIKHRIADAQILSLILSGDLPL